MAQRLNVPGYDEVWDLGGAFVALHAVIRGRAFGGMRIRSYPSAHDALDDALDLARAMSRKVVMAGIEGGGGKTVIHDCGPDRAATVRRVGEFIESLGGRYFTGPDLGFTAADGVALKSVTRHVACCDLSSDSARSVELAMRAVIEPRVVAVQGLGAVGRPLADSLRRAGVHVIGADLLGGDVPPDAICDVPCDVFAPCATGAVLNEQTIPRLRCSVVCGAANNPLASDADADRLRARGIEYVPDFIANSGATIRGASGAVGEEHLVEKRMGAIPDLVREVLARARRESRSPHAVATQVADERISLARGVRHLSRELSRLVAGTTTCASATRLREPRE